MKGGKLPQGYTIVEVMIVLAVSSMLLVVAMRAVNGYQAKAEFTQAVRDVESQVLDVANDVNAGYFPGYSNRTCSLNGSNEPQIVAGSNSQGTNSPCTFIGKAMQFNVDGSIDVYTLVGNRLIGTTDVTSLNNSKPTTDTTLIEKKKIPYGMKPDRISVSVEYVCPPYPGCGSVWNTGVKGTDSSTPASPRPSTIAFITSFGQTDTSGHTIGSPKAHLYVVRGSKADLSQASIVDLLKIEASKGEKTTGDPTADPNAVYLPVKGGYTICFVKDGKYVTLSLAAQDNNLTTRVTFNDIAAGCT